jgi:hypothetical protein
MGRLQAVTLDRNIRQLLAKTLCISSLQPHPVNSNYSTVHYRQRPVPEIICAASRHAQLWRTS